MRAWIWPGQGAETDVRLAGIDAPELRGGCADERLLAGRAKAKAAELAGWRVRLRDLAFDKYGGRMVARVEGDTGDVGVALVAAGLARPYDGRRRETWCPTSPPRP